MAITPEDALGLDEAGAALDNGWTLPARWYSACERSRNNSMNTPVSASSPINAMMPTQTAIETL